jgi:hypothetical protein
MLVPVLFPMNMKGRTEGEIKGVFYCGKKVSMFGGWIEKVGAFF